MWDTGAQSCWREEVGYAQNLSTKGQGTWGDFPPNWLELFVTCDEDLDLPRPPFFFFQP